MQKYLVQ